MVQLVLTSNDGRTEQETAAPSKQDVESRIAGLDGIERDLVILYRNDSHFAVGGSASGRLVASCTFDNQELGQLTSGGDPDAEITVMAGRQAGDYPANQVVGLAEVLTAVDAFVEDGSLAVKVSWKRS